MSPTRLVLLLAVWVYWVLAIYDLSNFYRISFFAFFFRYLRSGKSKRVHAFFFFLQVIVRLTWWYLPLPYGAVISLWRRIIICRVGHARVGLGIPILFPPVVVVPSLPTPNPTQPHPSHLPRPPPTLPHSSPPLPPPSPVRKNLSRDVYVAHAIYIYIIYI